MCVVGKGLIALNNDNSLMNVCTLMQLFHTNMHISCVASQLKWRVADQLWDSIAGKLVAYVGSWHLVRLVLCCPNCLLLPLPILITPIPAEFWACVCAKRDHWVSQTSLLHGRPCLLVFTCSVNICPCENTHSRPSAYCMCVESVYVLGTMIWQKLAIIFVL